MPRLQFSPGMADWKQISARIRRARTGKDPAVQLSNLYQKTRDAMVAFELARHLETAGQSAEAAKWYSTAAERFRRSEWKSKAQEAATRLGVTTSDGRALSESENLQPPAVVVPEPAQPFLQTAATFESIATPPEANAPSVSARAPVTARRQHRRRGGQNRRKNALKAAPAMQRVSEAQPAVAVPPTPTLADEILEPRFSKVTESASSGHVAPQIVTDSGAAAVRGRYGDPGVSSRLSVLEMQFRRLLSCTPLKLDEADRAPAGPGVFVLSDSDLTTNYYVEACKTLRIAIANLSRGASSRRGGTSIKPQLAEHLGIAESRVSKYLADHCVIRYLQLDEDAAYFAHFVIAVLRPVLNE
jgi:hypothetical protein